MVSVLSSCVVDRVFTHLLGLFKDIIIGVCCLSAKHVALMSKSKKSWAPSQYNVSE